MELTRDLAEMIAGAIKDRVGHYMKDLNTELWRLGVSTNQFKLATIFKYLIAKKVQQIKYKSFTF